jgi:hypothetical protein
VAVERQGERSAFFRREEPVAMTWQFQTLDTGIVSDAIPAFFIGRNKEGFWVAVTPRGRSAEFSCSRIPHCRLQERIAGRPDVQQYFYPRGSNSTSKTKAIRLSGTLAR